MKTPPRQRRGQTGFVLIVSLILLMVLTLLAISSINLSTTGLRIVNSMQSRSECMSGSQQVVDQLLSTYFVNNIATLRGATYTVSVNGNTCPVQVSGLCLKAYVPIRNSELDLSIPSDVNCFDTSTNPYSACSTSVWEIETTVSQGLFGTNLVLRQGVSVRMDTATALGYKATGTVAAPLAPYTTGYVCNAT